MGRDDIRKSARNELNAYLEAELGNSLVLPDFDELEMQRHNFLKRFGPEQLEAMNSQDLLQEMPYNPSNEEPMDHWLENKRDGDFDNELFGRFFGRGTGKEFHAWQDKNTGKWLTKDDSSGSESNVAALQILENRRSEALSAVTAIRDLKVDSAEDIPPEKLQRTIMGAAREYYDYGWLHKYLHLNFPNLVTSVTAKTGRTAQLYSVGIVPPNNANYVCDVEIIRFWSSLPALEHLPIPIRYRVGMGLETRDHWCLMLLDDTMLDNVREDNVLAYGSKQSTDLSEHIRSLPAEKKNKKGVDDIIRTNFQSTGLDHKSGYAKLLADVLHNPKGRRLVALFTGPSTIVELCMVTGAYRYDSSADRPHQIPVEWYGKEVLLSKPFDFYASPRVKPTSSIVAEMEEQLVVHRISSYYNSSKPETAIQPRPKNHSAMTLSEPDAPLPPMAQVLERKKQVIFYGPPGTGKTYAVARHCVEICNDGLSGDEDEEDIRIHYLDLVEQGRVEFITFHQSYSYEEFVEGLRPHTGDGAGFKLIPTDGVLKRMAERARGSDEPFVLVIDEINRANISKVMGELITLLEEDKREGAEHEIAVTLPYSRKTFKLPSNLYILGTMNTADRSIALIDTALRRRFEFDEIPPNPRLLNTVDGIDLCSVLEKINERLEWFLDRDHLIGHAWLMGASIREDVDRVMRHKIIPLIGEYFYDDWEKVRSVLGGTNDFVMRKKLTPPPDISEYERDDDRFQWIIQESFPVEAYRRLVTGSGDEPNTPEE